MEKINLGHGIDSLERFVRALLGKRSIFAILPKDMRELQSTIDTVNEFLVSAGIEAKLEMRSNARVEVVLRNALWGAGLGAVAGGGLALALALPVFSTVTVCAVAGGLIGAGTELFVITYGDGSSAMVLKFPT